MMDRETWLKRILDATRDIADESYQRRVWVRGEGPGVDSSTEALVRLMDDYDLGGFIGEAAEQVWISSEQLTALRRLDAALTCYAADDRSGHDADRIGRLEWRRIRELAKATLDTFTTPAMDA